MGNTFFYKKAKYNADSITWKDIFSDSFKKHSKKDLEYALAAGTSMNTATEYDMLEKWEKPWIWFPALKIGLSLVAAVYIIFFVTYYTVGGAVDALWLLFVSIPPLVIPIVVLIFLWELNIPKNISIYECGAFWVIGGMISLAMTLILDAFVITPLSGGGFRDAAFAPFTEEPAKLLTSLMIIAFIKKKKNVYGITGLVIGACVGAGFGAFESVQYAFHSAQDAGAFSEIILNQVMRGIFALGGHAVFCAPYSAAITYNMKDSKFSAKSFLNIEFAATFLFSGVMHFLWNSNLGAGSLTIILTKFIVIIVLLWIMLLWIVKKCLNQVVSVGRYTSMHHDPVRLYGNTGMNGSQPFGNQMPAYSAMGSQPFGGAPIGGNPNAPSHFGGNNIPRPPKLLVVCMGGELDGVVWRSDSGAAISIGRAASNTIVMPETAKGISRQHCELFLEGNVCMVRDMNSAYGTYVNGRRLEPGAVRALNNDDTVQLAGTDNIFKAVVE